VVLDGGHGADLKGLGVVSVRIFCARLDVMKSLDLAADGQSLLLADWSSSCN
jgi:hypothetical protein